MSAWEITERLDSGYTLWRSRDAEGRPIWCATRDRGPTAMEPTGVHINYDGEMERRLASIARNCDWR